MKLYFGFPIEGSKAPKDRAVAMIIAIMAMSIIGIFAANMIVTSSVTLELAVAQRDNVKAEYMSRSGLNLATFLLEMDHAIDLAMYQQTQKVPTDASDDFWSLINGIPIGGETIEMAAAMQEKFDLSKVSDSKVLDILKMFDGQFTIKIEDESSRINVSNCAKDKCSDTMAMLTALMSCPSERAFLEKRDLRPEAMAYRIKDWVDENKTAEPESGFNSEDDPYEKKFPAYKAKNAPMESLSELKLIEGWDDDMHTVFSRYLTIFPFPSGSGTSLARVNINTAKKELLACLVPSAKTECADRFFKFLLEQEKKGGPIASQMSEIGQVLSGQFCDSSTAEGEQKSNWFSFRSRFYRIAVEGNVGLQNRTLEAIIERIIPDKAKKIDQGSIFHYWKMR